MLRVFKSTIQSCISDHRKLRKRIIAENGKYCLLEGAIELPPADDGVVNRYVRATLNVLRDWVVQLLKLLSLTCKYAEVTSCTYSATPQSKVDPVEEQKSKRGHESSPPRAPSKRRKTETEPEISSEEKQQHSQNGNNQEQVTKKEQVSLINENQDPEPSKATDNSVAPSASADRPTLSGKPPSLSEKVPPQGTASLAGKGSVTASSDQVPSKDKPNLPGNDTVTASSTEMPSKVKPTQGNPKKNFPKHKSTRKPHSGGHNVDARSNGTSENGKHHSGPNKDHFRQRRNRNHNKNKVPTDIK